MLSITAIHVASSEQRTPMHMHCRQACMHLEVPLQVWVGHSPAVKLAKFQHTNKTAGCINVVFLDIRTLQCSGHENVR